MLPHITILKILDLNQSINQIKSIISHKHEITTDRKIQKYRVAQKSKPQSFVHIFAKYWPFFKLFFTGAFCEKFVVKWLPNIPPHLNCVATLPCEIWDMQNPSVFGENLNKSLELNFWPSLKDKLCFVLDRLSVFVNIRRRYCHTGWAKN